MVNIAKIARRLSLAAARTFQKAALFTEMADNGRDGYLRRHTVKPRALAEKLIL
jgi:hypothetical protein